MSDTPCFSMNTVSVPSLLVPSGLGPKAGEQRDIEEELEPDRNKHLNGRWSSSVHPLPTADPRNLH